MCASLVLLLLVIVKNVGESLWNLILHRNIRLSPMGIHCGIRNIFVSIIQIMHGYYGNKQTVINFGSYNLPRFFISDEN